MSEPGLDALIAAAEMYEELFVPAALREWAARMVEAAGIQPGQRVLDVACGTGILARTAAARVGSCGFVAGLDTNPGMLAVARRLAAEIEWRQGPAEALPYADRSFDAAVCQFGLMEKTPAYAIEIEIIERHAGPRAADPLRAPFVLGDRQALADLLASAGLASAEITTVPGLGRFPSIRTMVETDLRSWLPLAGVVLTDEQVDRILAEAENALRAYRSAAGTAVFASPAHVVTATKA